MPAGSLRYLSQSDIDPNVIDALFRALAPRVEDLIDDRQQRRQLWGPTFKQEGIAELPMPNATYTVPAPEYGKRTLVFAGSLTTQRTVILPILFSAWWILRNNTNYPLKFVAGVSGVEGPIVGPKQTAQVYTDGVSIFRITGDNADLHGFKNLTDNVQTNLFVATFAPTDHKGVAGQVVMTIAVKKTSPNQIQVYTKTVPFVAENNGSANSGAGHWGVEFINDSVTSFGGTTFVFSCNGTAHPGIATFANVFTFQITADTDLAAPLSEFVIDYNVQALGDAVITLV